MRKALQNQLNEERKYKNTRQKFNSHSIMSFVIAFMLFIYEPITTYASNTEDYWFDLKALLINNLVIFAVVLIKKYWKILWSSRNKIRNTS